MQCRACSHDNAPGSRFCSACGARLEAPGAAADGERRHATILFSDLSGYTALNERLDPEEVEEIMGRVKHEAEMIVERHGGIVNQFVGDEIMALFGIPTARRDDPQRAVRAALELHAVVRAIGAEIAPRIGQALCMHSGVNTGLVIARRSDALAGRYMVTGDAVNTGARLLKLAGDDEIVAGQDTWREISDGFVAEPGPAVEVKGKGQRITPFRIRGERSVELRPLYGREAELGRLRTMVEACRRDGTGRVAILRGEPGIGKSRLAAEILRLARDAGFRCHSALVLDFSAGRGRDAIRSLARGLVGYSDRAAFAPEQEIALRDLLDEPLAPELRVLAGAMGEGAKDRGTLEMTGALARNATREGPLCVLLEDLHWADPWTLERIGALAALAPSLPVLLVLTTRHENDPTTTGLAGTTAEAFDLGPLEASDARRLAAQFPEVSAATAGEYIARAEGNPLFLEQLLLNAKEVVRAGLPGSIQGLVLARLDRIPQADRAALQAASVLGQRFSLDALRHLLDSPGQDCEVLAAHFLVRKAGDEWLFWHALVRDGAYESLLKSRRRHLHAKAGEWFAVRDPALAGEHFERAADPRAAGAYLAACESEAAHYRYAGALSLADRGLALASAGAEQFSLMSARARILLEMGRAGEAIAGSEAALAAAGDDVERCRTLVALAAGMRIVERVDEGLRVLDRAEPLAKACGLALEQSRIHHLRGNLYFGLGRRDECLREHEAALAQARAAGSVEAEANALSGLGDAYYVRGRMQTAHEHFRRCMDLAHEHGLGRIEVANRHMMGWTAHYLNDLGQSLAEGLHAIETATAISHHRVAIIARHLSAYVGGWLMGEVEPAERHLEAALPLLRAMGAYRFEGQNLAYRALLARRRGDHARAAAIAREALEACRRHGMSFIGPVVLGVAGVTAADRGERARHFAEAEAVLERGAISHNHFEFHALAIDAALADADADAAARYCDALERYTAAERLPLSDLLIARGRALALALDGPRDGRLVAELKRLRAQAASAGLQVLLPAMDAALARLESR